VLAIGVAARPPDDNHPFGHAKAEYFSAGLEGALILVAAGSIVYEAVDRLRHPRALAALGVGLGISVLATAINALLSVMLIRTGRRWRSPALVADGFHIRTDVVSSLGAVVGVGLAWGTGWWAFDPITGILTAGQIVWTGVQTLRHSMAGLMDEAVVPAQREEIEVQIRSHLGPALEFHGLKTRVAGALTFIEFDLIVPGSLSVDRAHALCDEIEAALAATVGGAQITIHVEPDSEALHGAPAGS